MRKVPVLDLTKYIGGNIESQKYFSEELGTAFQQYGFAIVKNHGISDELVQNFYTLSKSFFSLPTEVKLKYEISGYNGQRGYTSFGKEHAKQSQVADLKEFYQIGQPNPPQNADLEYFMKNVFVDEIADFTKKGIELYQAFEKTGVILLQAIAEFLGLEKEYFDKRVKNGNSILRTIYYPPITQEPQSAIRAESHEDINLITLLVGASNGGLELLDTDGHWLEVLPQENEIAINVGDMLQRLTNNKLKSTTHRVTNPPKNQWHQDRLSIPFFLHPLPEVSLDVLEGCTDEDHPKLYEAISSGEYLEERLREIGLKNK